MTFYRFLIALGEPQAIDFADIACHDKGIDGIILNEFHEISEFTAGKQTLYFGVRFLRISSLDFIQAAAPHKIVDDVVSDRLRCHSYDAYTFALAQAGSKIVNDNAIQPCADDTDNDKPEGIDGKGGTTDDNSRYGDSTADVDMHIFADDFGDNIQSAGRTIDAEEYGLCGTKKKDKA